MGKKIYVYLHHSENTFTTWTAHLNNRITGIKRISLYHFTVASAAFDLLNGDYIRWTPGGDMGSVGEMLRSSNRILDNLDTGCYIPIGNYALTADGSRFSQYYGPNGGFVLGETDDRNGVTMEKDFVVTLTVETTAAAGGFVAPAYRSVSMVLEVELVH